MGYLKIICIFFVLPFSANAKDYNASLFGVKSDGLTLNTRSIQKGIDFISENGGGRLVFYVGRYLTGSVRLKSNVTIKLEEGAVLVGSSTIYDYNSSGSIKAIICADGQENIGISGKGLIEGRGALLLRNMKDLDIKGFLLDSLAKKPSLIGFSNCTGVQIDSVNMIDAAGSVQMFSDCNDLSIATVTVKSKNTAEFPGVIFKENKNVRLINTYLEVAGEPVQWVGDAKEIIIERTIDATGNKIVITQ